MPLPLYLEFKREVKHLRSISASDMKQHFTMTAFVNAAVKKVILPNIRKVDRELACWIARDGRTALRAQVEHGCHSRCNGCARAPLGTGQSFTQVEQLLLTGTCLPTKKLFPHHSLKVFWRSKRARRHHRDCFRRSARCHVNNHSAATRCSERARFWNKRLDQAAVLPLLLRGHYCYSRLWCLHRRFPCRRYHESAPQKRGGLDQLGRLRKD
jgi:hypothetical protein